MNKSYISSSEADNSYFSRVQTLIHQVKGNFLFITFFSVKQNSSKILIKKEKKSIVLEFFLMFF